jgi:hypothetical protein
MINAAIAKKKPAGITSSPANFMVVPFWIAMSFEVGLRAESNLRARSDHAKSEAITPRSRQVCPDELSLCKLTLCKLSLCKKSCFHRNSNAFACYHL